MLSGMKPPSIRPKSARQAKNEFRPDINACMLATSDQETLAKLSVKPQMGSANKCVHLDWDPIVWSYPFAHKLGGQFSGEEAEEEYGLPIVVVVGCELEIFQEVIRQGLRNIAAIQLKRKEHQANPSADPLVNLVYISLDVRPITP
jgi:hypothetical protein